LSGLIEAYLDVETTGLSPSYSDITVIGIHLVNGAQNSLVQLVGGDVTRDNILESLEGVHIIYTYNGSRFDLPFIHCCVGADLEKSFHHHDLMYDCWRCNLRGGLKAVECQLGISRKLKGIGGFEAVILWRRYQYDGDSNALAMLLQYNKEDVINLPILRERLNVK